MSAAVLLARRVALPLRLRVPALLAGVALIGWAAVSTTESGSFPAPAALPAVFGAALIIVAGTGPGLGRLTWPLTNRATRYVGRVSYSLYLWHWPVIIFLPIIMPRRDAYFDVAAICMAAAITVASFHFVEDPLRRMDYGAAARQLRAAMRRNAEQVRWWRDSAEFRRQGYAALAAVSLFSVGVITLALQPFQTVPIIAPAPPAAAVTQAVPNRIIPPPWITNDVSAALTAYAFPKLNPSVSQVSDAHGPEWKICGDVSAATLARCTFPSEVPGPEKKLVVLGDSFGIAWTPAMRAAQSHGYTVYELTHAQCPAIDANFREDVGNSAAFTAQCNAARNWYVSEIAKLKPDIVVIANYNAMLNVLADHATGQAAVDEWASGAKKIIERVRAAGAKRIVWLASPPASADLAECDQSSSATPADCVRTVGPTWAMVTSAETAVANAEHITMLDTSLFFCSANGYCPAFVGTTPTHADGHHLTGRYAEMIGPYIIPYVLGTQRAPT